MEEIHQLKGKKTKEKGSQHDPNNVANKEETSVGRGPQNTEQRFVTMADVVALLEWEKAKGPKERFCSCNTTAEREATLSMWVNL